MARRTTSITGGDLPAHFAWSAEQLVQVPVSSRLERCPEFLQELIRESIKRIEPNTVWVFGSRARGDHRTLSDYDLAFDLPIEREGLWADFKLSAQENLRTFLPQDWVLFSQASTTLKNRIRKEGIVIYERSAK